MPRRLGRRPTTKGVETGLGPSRRAGEPWEATRGKEPVLRTATASARRAGRLADRPTAPRACALEQTPLIRDAVSASECSQQGPEDGKELRRKAWFPRNAPWTRGLARQVPSRCRNYETGLGRALRVGGDRLRTLGLAAMAATRTLPSLQPDGCPAQLGRRRGGRSPVAAMPRMCWCTCIARAMHWSLLWYS